MTPKDQKTVNDLFSDIARVGQLDMRRRACDVIKAHANDPKNLDNREELLRVLAEIELLAVTA